MIERILDLLKLNNMTAKDLTLLLGVNRSTVSEWKKGKIKPSIEHIIKMSQIFSVSTDYLLVGVESDKQAVVDLSNNGELEKLRANDALTRRIEEVARQVFKAEIENSDK